MLKNVFVAELVNCMLEVPANVLLVAVVSALVGLLSYLHFTCHTEAYFLLFMKLARLWLGVKTREIGRKSGRGVWSFCERGQRSDEQPTVLFLHGIGGDANSWLGMLRYMPRKYHCVMVDMLGHGGTTFDRAQAGGDEASVEGFVLATREFLEVTGLDSAPITVIGTSYGGGVAALFAHDFPECVAKLILMCPVTRPPVTTPLYDRVFGGDYSVFTPDNGFKLTVLLRTLANKKVMAPEVIMNAAARLNFTPERSQLIHSLIADLAVSQHSKFEQNYEKMRRFKVKTLIIWGEDDQIIHVSGAHELHSYLADSTLKVLKDCNHVIMLDKPLECVQEILGFFERLD